MRDPIYPRRRQPLRSGNDELTPEGFEALLRFLHPEREQAGALYVALRRRLTRFFECRGVGWCEEVVDVTIARVAGQLAGGLRIHARDPFSYFRGVADRVAKEHRRKERQRHGAHPSLPPAPEPEEGELDRLAALEACLRHLPRERRDLFETYHLCENHAGGRRELARRLGLPMNALRIRAHRVRKELATAIAARTSGARNASSRRDNHGGGG